ncbi:MAG: helix-turn-helix transcriptional regulator [Oscillatoria sp. SIO1A7]|nr:helix-turn-helix transcriptional regulator [Oscillatoria sp. SIO1A7]
MEYFSKVSFSQEEIASFVGVNRNTVSEWRNGRSIPNLDPARTARLCIAMKCSLQELVDLFQPEESTPSLELHEELEKITSKRKKRGRPFKKEES